MGDDEVKEAAVVKEEQTEEQAPAEETAPQAEEQAPKEETAPAEGGEDAMEEAGDDAGEGEEGEEEEEPRGTKRKAEPEPQEPVTLGYKTFVSGGDACAYFKGLMSEAPKDTNLNEYEYKALLDLLKNGHPNAEVKIGGGLQAFQVRQFNPEGALAFYAVRKDGSVEDFSYLKCCGKLFSDVGDSTKRAKVAGGGRGGRHGGGRGRGRGGRGGARGRGGRGRGRGRK